MSVENSENDLTISIANHVFSLTDYLSVDSVLHNVALRRGSDVTVLLNMHIMTLDFYVNTGS
jgi:hypothetical protein